jgi:sporulation protein YlmC with PRC-barrel domain
MNKITMSLLATAALVATVPAFAQQKAPTAPAATPPAATAPAAPKVAIPNNVFYKGQGPSQYLARIKLIGAKVVNKDGVIIGDIEDLIMSANSNEVEGVIMGVGGFLGAGEKKVGVRYAALKFDKKDGKTVISLPAATKEVLAALDTYTTVDQRKSLLERAKEKAKELSDKAKDSGALEKAKEVGKNVVDKSKELGAKAVEKGKEAIDAAKGTAAPKQ